MVRNFRKASLDDDPDIKLEQDPLSQQVQRPEPPRARHSQRVPLVVVGGSFQGTPATAQLLAGIGGSAAIHRMTTIFYKKAFADYTLDKFIRDHNDPHGQRMGNWLVEKMTGEGRPWSAERATRPQCPVRLADNQTIVVHDRSSAHYAAWFSPKREPHKVGQHFKLDDARTWMSLNFLSCREAGLFEHAEFIDWYIRFIGHFVRVYERAAPIFARQEARWSEDPANVEQYISNGRRMQALGSLDPEYANDINWPYD